MSKLVLIFSLCSLISLGQNLSDNPYQDIKKDTLFKNAYGEDISKKQFLSLRSSNEFLDIYIDSLTEFRLVKRITKGKLPNGSTFFKYLERTYNLKLDYSQTVVINYHPGLDLCNTSGSATRSSINRFHERAEKQIKKFTDNKILFIAKESGQILTRDAGLNYMKDLNGVIENKFFVHHYPCGSLLLIDSNGYYISYFGEYGYTMATLLYEKLYSDY